MSDAPDLTAPAPEKRIPGPVIFVAVLDFVSVSMMAILAVFCLIGLIYGNAMGMYQYISTQLADKIPSGNFSYGLSFIFALAFAFFSLFTLYFVLLGIGLLKGKRIAWYFQVAVCVLGLFAFPMGTVINAVILFLFFRQPVRDFFKV